MLSKSSPILRRFVSSVQAHIIYAECFINILKNAKPQFSILTVFLCCLLMGLVADIGFAGDIATLVLLECPMVAACWATFNLLLSLENNFFNNLFPLSLRTITCKENKIKFNFAIRLLIIPKYPIANVLSEKPLFVFKGYISTK